MPLQTTRAIISSFTVPASPLHPASLCFPASSPPLRGAREGKQRLQLSLSNATGAVTLISRRSTPSEVRKQDCMDAFMARHSLKSHFDVGDIAQDVPLHFPPRGHKTDECSFFFFIFESTYCAAGCAKTTVSLLVLVLVLVRCPPASQLPPAGPCPRTPHPAVTPLCSCFLPLIPPSHNISC